MKYKQKIIPSVTIPPEWKSKKGYELRTFVFDYVKEHYAGTTIINEDTGISIKITVTSGRKTAYGEAIYSKKAAIMYILPDVLRYATRNNFGEPKPTDGTNILGYINFKCKCRIDNKLEHLRIAVQIQKGGKFYYNIEVNKKTST